MLGAVLARQSNGDTTRNVYADYQQFLRHPDPDVFLRCRTAPQAQFAIDSGEMLAGGLPRAQTRLVQARIEIHKDELASA